MLGWQDEIENYWLIEDDGVYEAFYVPTSGQVMFEEDMDIHLYSKMIAAGVKVVPADEFVRYLNSKLTPEIEEHENLDPENPQKQDEDEKH